ncbi:MAG: F0F1 ATP synthase subunit epsilon [Thermodesulfobacteriota bacterium]
MNRLSLAIFLPNRLFRQIDSVVKVVAEGLEGFFTLLPRHVDYVTVLVPGILTVQAEDGRPLFFAVDHGTLIKQNRTIRIATRNCIEGKDLPSLARIVAEEFYQLDDLEKKARTALAGLEHAMLRRFAELKKN